MLLSQGNGGNAGFWLLLPLDWALEDSLGHRGCPCLEWRACIQTPLHPALVVRAPGLRVQRAGETGGGQLGRSRGLRVIEGPSAAGGEDRQGKAGRPGSQSRGRALTAASAFSRLFVLLKIQT